MLRLLAPGARKPFDVIFERAKTKEWPGGGFEPPTGIVGVFLTRTTLGASTSLGPCVLDSLAQRHSQVQT
jgi:hypothetical protein